MADKDIESEQAGALAAPLKKMTLLLLSMVVILSALPLDVMLPSYPALALFFGMAMNEVTLFVAVFAVGFAISQVIVGPLSDRYGRKRILIIGLCVSLVGVFGCVFSADRATFIGYRLVQGLGCGCFVLTQALVQDIFSAQERQNIRIFLISLAGICISVSPLCGTYFQYVWGWQGSFYVSAALAFAILLLTVRILPGLDDLSTTDKYPVAGIIQTYVRIFSNKTFVHSWLISALAFSSHFGFIAISPLIFLEELGTTNITYSLILLTYGIAYFVGGLVASRLSKRLSIAAQINVGLSFSGFSGLLMLAMVLPGVNMASVLVPMIICTLGTTMVRPASVSRAMDIFGEQAGAASAAGGTLMFVTGGLVSFVLAVVPWPPSWSLAVFILFAAIISYALNRMISRSSPDSKLLAEEA